MKIKLYYIIPFAVMPILMLLCEMMFKIDLPISPYIVFVVLTVIFSAIEGFFSPTHRFFDCLLAVIIPLSLFCFMFIGGFLDKTDMGTRFRLSKAIDVAFQLPLILMYIITAITTFLCSFKPLRNLKNRRPKN